jgi:hypothetical protein
MMISDSQTERSFETEKEAMLLDRLAVLHVIGALRTYREAAKALLASRYTDGECDAVALSVFEQAVDRAEKTMGSSGVD